MANIKAKCAINGFRVEMCSIIHDELNFKGVLTATHELAHMSVDNSSNFTLNNIENKILLVIILEWEHNMMVLVQHQLAIVI